MTFDDLLTKGDIKIIPQNLTLITSMIKIIENDLLFLKRLKLDSISSRKILIGYYDILRMIIETIGLKKGYRIYSHEALTYLLIKINEYDSSQKFDCFRQLRNSLVHNGNDVTVVEVRIIINDIRFLINRLKNIYLY